MEKRKHAYEASSPMSWRVALHHRLPPEPLASPPNARSPARALLCTEPRTTAEGPDQRAPPHGHNKHGASCPCSQVLRTPHPP
eukprot:SAG31_NODE_10651_length_1113_cov_50.499014_3_plen_82_part_01